MPDVALAGPLWLRWTPFSVAPDIVVLPSFLARPASGGMVVNAFLFKAKEPVLVDCGLYAERNEFRRALEAQIDLRDLRWIWLTHPDPDHIGSLKPLLEEAPQARLVTNSVGFGVLSLIEAVPLERAYFLNPGERLDVGDRELQAVKPPAYDHPATMGFYDARSGAFFSSDCFGAVLQEPAPYASDIDPGTLHEGQLSWARADFPWLHKVDERGFHAELGEIRRMEPSLILGSHLPPSRGMTEQFLDALGSVPGSEPSKGMTQSELEDLLADLHSRGD